MNKRADGCAGPCRDVLRRAGPCTSARGPIPVDPVAHRPAGAPMVGYRALRSTWTCPIDSGSLRLRSSATAQGFIDRPEIPGTQVRYFSA